MFEKRRCQRFNDALEWLVELLLLRPVERLITGSQRFKFFPVIWSRVIHATACLCKLHHHYSLRISTSTAKRVLIIKICLKFIASRSSLHNHLSSRHMNDDKDFLVPSSAELVLKQVSFTRHEKS